MDEIRLLNILASPSQNVKQPGITEGNSTNLPPIITRFPPGSILAGFIINRDPAGNPVLRTPENGDITFQTKLFLKIGAEVVIRIENRTGQQQAHILTIDGKPPESPEHVVVKQPPFGVQPAQTPASAAPPPATDTSAAPLARAATPAATVSTQPNITATVTGNSSALPQGSALTLKIVSAESPQPTTTASTPPPGNTQPAPAAQYAAYARASGSPAAPPAVTITQPTATPATPATTTIAPPPTQPATIAPVSNTPVAVGQTLQVTVTGSTQAGQTIVQTPEGTNIQLNTTTPLSPGIRLNVEVSQFTPASAQTTTPQTTLPPAPAPLATLAHRWESLAQIVSLLSASAAGNPLSASGLALLTGLGHSAQAQSGASPQAISTGLMVFIAALRGGDFRGWLGHDNAKRLEDAGHSSLIKKAEGEFLSLARQFTDAPPSQWQSLFFPLAVHGEVQQARLFVKRDHKNKGGDRRKGDEDTRFIVELELSQMGELQLDGFVRKDPKSMEFDLFIRTRQPLDEDAQQAIFAIYNDTGQLTGYKGKLIFQTVTEFPVRPLEETVPEHASDVKI